jgi:hypothetical protein
MHQDFSVPDILFEGVELLMWALLPKVKTNEMSRDDALQMWRILRQALGGTS